MRIIGRRRKGRGLRRGVVLVRILEVGGGGSGGAGAGAGRGGAGGQRGGWRDDAGEEDADGVAHRLGDGDGASADSVGVGSSTLILRAGGGGSGATRRPVKKAKRWSATTVPASGPGSGSGARGIIGGSASGSRSGSGSGIVGSEAEVNAPQRYLAANVTANAVAVTSRRRECAKGPITCPRASILRLYTRTRMVMCRTRCVVKLEGIRSIFASCISQAFPWHRQQFFRRLMGTLAINAAAS